MKKKVFLFVLITCNILWAQKVLTLEEALSIALKESYSIKNAKYSLQSSQKSLEAAKLGLYTTVDLNFTLPSYTDNVVPKYNYSLKQEEYVTEKRVDLSGNFQIRQPIIATNGYLSITGQLNGNRQYSTKNNDQFYSDLKFVLNQPLFTYNTLASSLEKAEMNLAKSKRNYTQSEREIVYNVTASFFSLYKAKKSFEITNEKVKQTEDSYNTARNKYMSGLIPEVQALQLEVDLAQNKNQLLDAERDFDEQKNEFKLLIGLSLEEALDVVAQLEYKPVNIDEEKTLNSALENRPDLINAKEDIKLSKMNIEETDAQRSVKANLNANYGITTVDTLFQNMYEKISNNRGVSLTLSVPVLDWGRHNRQVEAAEINLKMSEEGLVNKKLSIIREVRSLINRVNSAKARVEVMSKSIIIAQKSYEISIERFKSGKITSNELSQEQTRFTQSQLDNLNALIDYKLAIANLSRQTFIDFE